MEMLMKPDAADMNLPSSKVVKRSNGPKPTHVETMLRIGDRSNLKEKILRCLKGSSI